MMIDCYGIQITISNNHTFYISIRDMLKKLYKNNKKIPKIFVIGPNENTEYYKFTYKNEESDKSKTIINNKFKWLKNIIKDVEDIEEEECEVIYIPITISNIKAIINS